MVTSNEATNLNFKPKLPNNTNTIAPLGDIMGEDSKYWYFVTFKGKNILVNDYIGLNEQQIVIEIENILKRFLAGEVKDVLFLLDVTDAKYNTKVAEVFHKAAKVAKPYIRKSAVVGIDGIKSIILSAVNRFSDIGIRPFNSRNEAFEWLVSE